MMGEKTDHVVVWDPSGDFWQGGIVTQEVADSLVPAGVVMLPVERRLLEQCAIGGFFFRSWGAGVPLPAGVPRMVCPMAMYVARLNNSQPDAPTRLSWVARLVQVAPYGVAEKPTGMIRLAPDSGQLGTFSGGVSATDKTAVDLSLLGAPDAHGGWTVRGEAGVNVAIDAVLGLGLYCSGEGARIAWAAVSQSR
jgi:hypothetical protein